MIGVSLPSDFQPFEYFCFGCGRLRLCCDPKLEGCKNCGAPFTHKGKPCELDGLLPDYKSAAVGDRS
jgi:hypothetical protein